MCLAVPMQITSLVDERKALVQQGRTSLEIDISLLAEAKVGDFVIVHAGFAISQLDEQEALEVFEYLREIQELGELESGAGSRSG